jgi:quercetin dioxygenase-like cupin family protein
MIFQLHGWTDHADRDRRVPFVYILRKTQITSVAHDTNDEAVEHMMSKRTGYPEVITRLPEADISIKGIRAHVLQGEKHQLVFFEMEPCALVPEHNHEYDQWGMMIEGKMELIIDGKTRTCEKGDEYVIPAHVKHRARVLSKSRVMDFFSEKDRYRIRTSR